MNKKIIALHLKNDKVVLAEIVGIDEEYRTLIKTDFQEIGVFWLGVLEEYYVEEYIEPTSKKNVYVIQ